MINSGSTCSLTIDGIGINGEGVGKYNGFTLFVEGALPTEEIVARIGMVKKSYAKASLVSVKKPSVERVDAPCQRFAECGGCQIMHLSYDAQLKSKTRMVKDALKHIGRKDSAEVLDCISSPKDFQYRNKIQLPVGKVDDETRIGFYKRGSHEIIPYEKCLIHHPSMEDTVSQIKSLIKQSTIAPYCEKTRHGTLRHIIIRANDEGQQLLGLVTTGRKHAEVKAFAALLMQKLEGVVGVVESVNNKAQNTILGEHSRLLLGNDFLIEQIQGLKFKISLESFFQVNLAAASLLYDQALSLAKIDANTRVLDAYCGTGTLSLLSAKRAKSVIGIECVEQAVKDARENAKLNQITNARFAVGRVEDKIELFRDIDVALVNPPRKGLDERVVQALNDHGPGRVVYISCNPATLARDVLGLKDYSLVKVQPVDMFPQTMHVESVALLERISQGKN